MQKRGREVLYGLSDSFDISTEAACIVRESEQSLQAEFAAAEKQAELMQYRVIDAFRHNEVSARHFNPTNGYGYGDEGRDKLGSVFAEIVGAEDAIVSPLLMSGTHAIGTALFGLLRPGDRVLCITGEPYDTMRKVVRSSPGSLDDLGVGFDVVPLTPDNRIDIELAAQEIESAGDPSIIYIQRSTGYDLRPAFTTNDIKAAIAELRQYTSRAIFFVDNCYGEFVCSAEPSAEGADVIAGSMIKNPGGGLAPTGGYIAGRHDLIERIGSRYSVPGVSREIGSYASSYQPFYEGIFMAPHVVSQAIKGVILASDVFSKVGYTVSPGAHDPRGDITQVIIFKDKNPLIRFVRGIQRASAVDAHVVPYAWDMPGYDDQVIMAAGTFVQGASLELTADAPIRPPFAAYLQGGLTYSHAKLGVLCALSDILRAGKKKNLD